MNLSLCMRRLAAASLIFPLLAAALVAQVPQTQRPFVNPVPIPANFKQAIENGTRTTYGHPGPNYWVQNSDYTIQATLHPDQNRITAGVVIHYHNNSPDTLGTLHLDLDMNLHKKGAMRIEPAEVTEAITIRNVSVMGNRLSEGGRSGARYFINGTRMVVIPPGRVLPGTTVTIAVDWTLDIPQAGGGARMGYDSGNLFFMAYWFPRMTVYDDIQGWHPDPFLSQAEFYHDFGNYDISIMAPADWVVMSTGEFLNPQEVLADHVLERYQRAGSSDETVSIITRDDFGDRATRGTVSDTLTWRFRAENVRDLAFSATRSSLWDGARAAVGDRNGDGETDYIRVNSFWRETAPLWSKSIEYMQHSITFLSEYTGLSYPWPHMTAVEAANIIGGGMEFPMMTLIGDYNQRGADALYSVTFHEIAHMWIPMIISTDERRYSWIDEGYTVFQTDSGKEDYLGTAVNHRELTKRGYLFLAQTGREGEMMRWSDFQYSSTAFRVASYQKPATILTALRGVLGEEVFYRIHKKMFETWSYKLMSPYDWFAFFEHESGRDLSWFWRAWYFETWTMDQGIEQVRQTRNATQVVIRDFGDAPMPVHLLVTLQNGEERFVRHDSVDAWLGGSRTTTITLPMRNVVRVEIDPSGYFPDTNRSNNVWEK